MKGCTSATATTGRSRRAPLPSDPAARPGPRTTSSPACRLRTNRRVDLRIEPADAKRRQIVLAGEVANDRDEQSTRLLAPAVARRADHHRNAQPPCAEQHRFEIVRSATPAGLHTCPSRVAPARNRSCRNRSRSGPVESVRPALEAAGLVGANPMWPFGQRMRRPVRPASVNSFRVAPPLRPSTKQRSGSTRQCRRTPSRCRHAAGLRRSSRNRRSAA